MPLDAILGKEVTRQLTPKMRGFALDVAKGATKADAYRKNYNAKSKHTMTNKPYVLARDERVKAEIEAYQVAIEAAKHRTPAQLRDLVIHSLVQVIINPDSKPNQITQAAKVLGTVTEVAAFTERKEVTTITSSSDAKAQIMQQLKQLMKADAVDAVEIEAGSLLAELNGVQDAETVEDATHRPATPQASQSESQDDKHTIPLKGLPQDSIPLKRSSPEQIDTHPIENFEHLNPDQDPETPPGSET